MAVTISYATFPGNSSYRLRLEVDHAGTTIYATARVEKLSGAGFWTGTDQWYRIRIAGQNFDGNWRYDFRGTSMITVRETSKAVGVGSHAIEAWVNMDSGIGQAYTSQTRSIAGVPGAPAISSVLSITTSSGRVTFNDSNANGSAITQTQVQWSRNSGFTNIAWTDTINAPDGSSQPSADGVALTPATQYWVRARQRNGVGWGAYSVVRTFTTLPATAPVINGVPSISGQGVTITLSPPSGVSGVTEYNIEYREQGTATVTAVTSTTTTRVISGLTPGKTYEYRANAEIGTYTSPWTAWIAIAQPNPNTSPGDFFDGSSPARANITYAWTGAAGNSISEARGVGVEGWAATPAAGAITRVMHATTDMQGLYAARMLFLTGTTTPGSWVGMANGTGFRAEVEQLAYYVGSMFAEPSRSQRLAARIRYLTAMGGEIISYVGDAQVVQPGTPVRLVVGAQAPPTAEFAIVEVGDVSGAGWVPWQGGDHLDADGANVTLDSLYPPFDGNTPDEPGFNYAWVGPANRSPSTRTVVPVVIPDPLQDPDCSPIPTPPRPPQIATDCIEEVGEWRRYTVTIPSLEVRRWSATVPVVVLTTGASPERQVRIRFYPNPDNQDADEVDKSEWEAELILTYVPPASELTIDGVAKRAYASVQGGEPLPANHLLYGTGGAPATWPEFTCGVAYVVTFDTPLEAPSGNLGTRMLLTQRM